MLAAPTHGFVFLCAPKTASTAVQQAFSEHAQLLTSSPPSLKHIPAVGFDRDFAPILARHGFERSSYVTTSLIREPVDLAVSWYRYRTRRGLRGRPRYTGDMSFDAFAELIASGEDDFRPGGKFYCSKDGSLLVERLYKYDHMDDCIAWMSQRVGASVQVPRINASPAIEVTVSAFARRLLEELLAVDLELYAAAR